MTSTSLDVFGGVDTHGKTHHAAAIDGAGRLLGDAEFAATAAGYAACWPGWPASAAS
jgi:transposase